MTGARVMQGVAGGLLAAAGLVLAGCGGSAPFTISSSASRQLEREVAAIRADAIGEDPGAGAHDVAALEASVAVLVRAGQLSPERAASILDAARIVQADLVLIPTTTTSTTTTTTTTTPPPPKGPKHDRGNQGPGGDGGG